MINEQPSTVNLLRLHLLINVKIKSHTKGL